MLPVGKTYEFLQKIEILLNPINFQSDEISVPIEAIHSHYISIGFNRFLSVSMGFFKQGFQIARHYCSRVPYFYASLNNNNIIVFFFYIVPPKSAIWHYFIKSGAVAKCKICQLNVKTAGNTTNLHFHMNCSHPDIQIDFEKKSMSLK